MKRPQVSEQNGGDESTINVSTPYKTNIGGVTRPVNVFSTQVTVTSQRFIHQRRQGITTLYSRPSPIRPTHLFRCRIHSCPSSVGMPFSNIHIVFIKRRNPRRTDLPALL